VKPHKTQGWLNPKCTKEELVEGSKKICEVYLEAPEKWEKEGIKTISTDEKTGIQALQRTAPDKPMIAGQCRKQEYEYQRHGTKCLIANWDVVEGKIICPSITDTRDEVDFLEHIERTIHSDRKVKKWRFVVDNLNTHQSQCLVLLVANMENTPDEQLGEKGKSGILQSMKTRAEFLQNTNHAVHFVYTPKHCSWLNQIEIWFSILSRKVLKRGSFNSKDDLKNKIEAFIDYFNRVLAKPFKWTYNGKPCYI
jgi:transposase